MVTDNFNLFCHHHCFTSCVPVLVLSMAHDHNFADLIHPITLPILPGSNLPYPDGYWLLTSFFVIYHSTALGTPSPTGLPTSLIDIITTMSRYCHTPPIFTVTLGLLYSWKEAWHSFKMLETVHSVPQHHTSEDLCWKSDLNLQHVVPAVKTAQLRYVEYPPALLQQCDTQPLKV